MSPSKTSARPLIRNPNAYLYFSDDGRLLAVDSADPDRSVEATPLVIELLRRCDGQRPLGELVAELSDLGPANDVERAAGELHAARLLVEKVESGHADEDGYGYARPEIHRAMLQDDVRTEAFRQALEEVTGEGSVVIDLGTGTGILALFAAQAGASEVHAIEYTSIVEQARRVAEVNGLSERIRFYQGDAGYLDLDVRADVLVSEWLGYFVFSDGMFPAVARVRDRCLKPSGVLVPSDVDLFLAPISDEDLQGPAYWASKPYGFDLSTLLDEELRFSQIRTVKPEALLAPPELLYRIDCKTAPPVLDFDVRVAFTIQRTGQLDAFCGHFNAQLSPSVVLDTAPGLPDTHWQQHVFSIYPVQVEAGDVVEVHFRADEAPYDSRLIRLHLDGTVRGKSGERKFSATYDQ